MKKWKRWMAVLLAVVCVMGAAPAAYADEPSGPASDIELIERAKQNTESNAETEVPQDTGGQEQTPEAGGQEQVPETGGQEQAQDTTGQEQPQEAIGPGQPEQTAEEAAEPEGTTEALPEQSTEGLILSGGRYIDPAKPMIALTFDDGPYAPVGNRIMDYLELYNGRATFYVVGNRVPSYQTEILRMHNNGHEIGNHTYEHKFLNKLNASQIRYQIEQCNQVIAAVTGQAPTTVRLPGGNKNNTVLANINEPIFMWSIDTLDWKTRNAAKTVQSVLGHVQDGDIVLMHELYPQTADAVAVIIPALAEQGFQFVTISELAQFRGGMVNGGLYYNFRR